MTSYIAKIPAKTNTIEPINDMAIDIPKTLCM
ncbi:hypothetical protein Q604_UNBC16274G0001, partial [human gut metagenome]